MPAQRPTNTQLESYTKNWGQLELSTGIYIGSLLKARDDNALPVEFIKKSQPQQSQENIMGMIIEDIHQLANMFKHSARYVFATSGGFDPLHVGHLRCIQETAARAKTDATVVIVNGDGFLERKKGYVFMPHKERMEIIAGIQGVDYVVGWDDGSQTVTGALEILKPNFFMKGGDRVNPDVVPEFKLCERIGCKVVFNVGGEKIQSSSELVNSFKHALVAG